jgi:transcriptional regulator
MSDKQFRILSEKLDTLIKLTAINALKGKNLTDQVEILSEIGLQPKQIATILGTDPATVSTLKSRVKKKRTKKAEKESDKKEQ